MSPDQKAASIHLAFVFMTIQGRGQHQVRPTEIHRDYFVNVGCLCSVGVFYNRLLKLCRSLFVLVSQQGRSEHRNCFGFPLSLFLNFCSFLLFFLLRQSTASPTPSFFFFFSKFPKCEAFGPGSAFGLGLDLGCQVCSPTGAYPCHTETIPGSKCPSFLSHTSPSFLPH